MWRGEPSIRTTNNFLERTDGADGTLPEAPQDNLGAYTLQAGDTLEKIALQVYGDASLWYLLADANGITDKNAQAGNSSELHIGQRLNIPPVATGQHHTSGTHKVLNSNQIIGNTSASLISPRPPAPPPLPQKNHGLFSKIIVGIIAVVATVMTAGIVGALAGAALQGGGGLFALGMGVLGGTATTSTGVTLAAGFAAGFMSSIASQGAAKALGMQEGIDFKGALISGLATAATGGLLRGLNTSSTYKGIVDTLDNLSLSKVFSTSSAAQMMEQNALSQGINLSLKKHQHFDWEQLATAGISAGLMGGTMGRKLDQTLRAIDHNTGILSSEARALTTAGTHFDATQVLTDNLGSAIGSSIVGTGNPQQQEDDSIGDDSLYLTDTVLDIVHPERTLDNVYQNYLTQQLNGSDGYESLSLKNTSEDVSTFENQTYWGAKHGLNQIINDPSLSIESMGLSLQSDSKIVYQKSSYTKIEALDIHMSLKGSSTSKYWIGGNKLWADASREQVKNAMDVDKLFADPVKKMQFLDLHYQEGLNARDIDALFKGKGLLEGKGEIFLKASKENNLNPLYLVGHALLESGQGKSPLAKANNFFGMGAHDRKAYKDGIKFAKDHGWSTPELGVMGAAKIISEQWINRSGNSQSNLYSMRWNPMSPGKNQYATDIHWATSQTNKIYTQVNKMMAINPLYQPRYIVPKYYQ